MCNEEWGSQTQPKVVLSQQSSTNSKYYLMHRLWSMTTSSLPELSVRSDWVRYQEETLKSLSWISLAILPPFSCDTDWHWHSLCSTIFPHQGLTSAVLTHVFGLHSLSACCAALWCVGQLTTTAPSWAQVAFAASTTQSGETKGPYIISSKYFNRFTSRRSEAQDHHASFVQLEALAPNCKFLCKTPLCWNMLPVPSKGLMETTRKSTLLFTCEPKNPSLLLETPTSTLFVCKALR